HRAEKRSWMRSLKAADAFSRAHEDPAILDAVLEAPETLPLSPDLIERLRDRREIFAFREAYSTSFRLSPSANDPTADGFDGNAANAAADEAVKTVNRHRDEVDAAERVLVSSVQYVALATDWTLDDVFSLLSGDV